MTGEDTGPQTKTKLLKTESDGRMRKSARQIRQEQVQLSINFSKNLELKKLQLLAPGPEMTAICESENVTEEDGNICKIRPAPDWQPPFSVDVEKLRFLLECKNSKNSRQ